MAPEPELTSRLRVTSNGVGVGTVVTVDGKELIGVMGVRWEVSAADQAATLVLTIDGLDADVDLEALGALVQIVEPEIPE